MTCIICYKALNKEEKWLHPDICQTCYSFLEAKHKTGFPACLEQHRRARRALK